MSKKILIVDDSKFTRTLLALPLERLGYWVENEGDPHEAVTQVIQKKPDLVISDLRMPDVMDGLGFLKMISLEAPQTAVLVYTSDAGAADKLHDIGIGRLAVLTKPAAPDRLKDMVASLLAAEP